MESRIKGRVLSIIVAGAMIASTSTALAATTKPTPKPTAKATAKVTPKPTVKTTRKATVKPTAKASAKVTPKSTKKAVVKKTTVKKKTVYKRKVVKVSPSPSPTWPPKGFTNPSNSEIYYRIPTRDELLGELSAAAALSAQFKACAKLACGVVTLASVNGCTWWEIYSTVYGPLSATDSTLVPYGTLRTTAKGTDKKQMNTVILISSEPLKLNVSVGSLKISCYHSPLTEKVPTNVYTVNTPAPSESPTTNTN